MFGYIKPFKPELKISEYEAYKSVYCGLCHKLGKTYGQIARLSLSYDFTYLAMLFSSVSGESLSREKKRCCVNPLKKVGMSANEESLSFSADIAAMLIYHKLLDNIEDSGLIKGIGFRILKPFAKRSYAKAAKARPEAAEVLSELSKAQGIVEQRECDSLDEACEPTAAAMSKIFAMLPGNENQSRVLSRIGYLAGRFIYMCDALDDIDKDYKSGCYNPLIRKYGHPKGDMRDKILEETKRSLYLSASELEFTCGLLDMHEYRPILLNISNMGFRAEVQEILSGKETKNG